MDSFTENILARARERQKLLEMEAVGPLREVNTAKSSSQPNLSQPEKNICKKDVASDSNLPSKLTDEFKENGHSEDNVRVEVQIEEHSDEGNESETTGAGLRQDAKNRLKRLGKLYAGDEDISSPIHKTESKFLADVEEEQQELPRITKQIPRKGLSKLADLAQNINQWEDELTPRKENMKSASPKKSWKPPAPQPPKEKTPQVEKRSQVERVKSPPRSSPKGKAPPPPLHKDKKNEAKLKWDKTVLDTLADQRNKTETIKEEDDTKTVDQKENVILKTGTKSSLISEKAAIFEKKDGPRPVKEKDPALLSVSERKALFEKNKGAALVPKAAFAMATPVKSTEKPKNKSPAPKPPAPQPLQSNVEVVSVVPQGTGIASKMAALLENKSTISQEQIESQVKEQRQKEMDVLLNRFNRNKETKEENKIIEDEKEEESEEEYITEETHMIPEKEKKVQIVSPPKENRRSGGKRFSSNDSPKVAAVLSDVKRIKVSPQKAGRLYPSLSDIETTATETENETRSPTPTPYSSLEGSFADSDEVNTSFGRGILQVCINQTPQKRPVEQNSSGSDMSDILDDSNEYIDEALAFEEGPTPPKHSKASNSFKYQDARQIKSPPSSVLPEYVVDGENLLPLTHTVSFYRRQQNTSSTTTTPVRKIVRIGEESTNNQDNEDSEVQKKIEKLEKEIAVQEMTISQTSRALNLCNSTPEFMGSTEQVEAERVLLVSTHRRQAALMEVQRLKVENSLRPQNQHSKNFPIEQGTLTISNITLPLKQKYVTALAAAGGKGHHVICLIKCGEQVVPTQLVSTVATDSKNPDLELKIPGSVILKNVLSGFAITFEVYCLQAQEEILPHEVKYHIKKNNKSTPKKNKDSKLAHPMIESPAGPQAVRSPTFAMMGYVVFSVQAISKKHWTLNNTPSMSPLEGTVEMTITCESTVCVEHRGFLTMFDDVSGFGAWHRRWCLLKGHTLSYWKYPDDEKRLPPIDTINLKNCITKQVGPVSREICARMHTFLIERERAAYPSDKDTLVMVRKGDKTIMRHLLSADTKDERIEWCNKFNTALAALNIFKQ